MPDTTNPAAADGAVEALASAIHKIECAEGDAQRAADGWPPVEKWADPWLPTGALQLRRLRRDAAAVRAALHAAGYVVVPRDATEWLPIKTAKKDGRPVDLWCNGPFILSTGPCRVPDCWFSSGRWWRYDETGLDGQCRSEVHHATHWRPVPSPPAAAERDGE